MNVKSSPSTASPERLLSVACPTCGATIAVDAELLGNAAECPLCGQGFRLPAAASSSPPSRPASTKPSRPDEATSIPPRNLDQTAELKRTSAERAARRARRNVAMLLAGGSILLGIVMLLGRSRR